MDIKTLSSFKPEGGLAVTVANTNIQFPLVRIPTGTLRRFQARLIETNSAGVRLNLQNAEVDTLVEITELLHFKRMYLANDPATQLRYLVNKNKSKIKGQESTYVLTHLIQGVINPKNMGALNREQMMLAQLKQMSGEIEEGSILDPATSAKFSMTTLEELYNRPLRVDEPETQKKVRNMLELIHLDNRGKSNPDQPDGKATELD